MTTLRVHRWCNEYLAPPGSGARDLDRLADRVAEALAGEIGLLPGLDESEVVLLRELHLAIDLDPGCAPGQIVTHWSRQLADALLDALETDQAVRFPTLSAYHARFIADLLEGRAWDNWMYRRFEGLRPLPPGAVVRTLLVEDSARGRATLAAIPPSAWPALFAALPAREAARILWQWNSEDRPDASAHAFGADLLAWAASRPALPGALASPLAALWLLGGWERAGLAGLPAGLACWLAALLTLPEGSEARHLRRIAGHADLDALSRAPSASRDPDWLLMLATAPRSLRTLAAAMATRLRGQPPAAPRQTDEEDIREAPCAGLAWLLPALLQLLRGPAASLPPGPAGATALDLAAMCALALISGPHGGQAWRDPFWCAFLHLPPSLAIEALDGWLAPHDPRHFVSALHTALLAQSLGPALRLRGRRREDVCRLIERGSGCPLGPAGPGSEDTPASFSERLALARLQRRDTAWLASSPAWAGLPPGWRDAFALLAAATLRRSANRIPGMARASIPYLFANVLAVSGQATRPPAAAAWRLETARAPLQVLLTLNGMARLHLDWPGGRSLDLRCAE